jgi:DNA polymerase III delta subunit
VDKRKVFYKACDAAGVVEVCAGWLEDKNWAGQAEMWARGKLRELGKEIDHAAAAQLVTYVGPNQRQLHQETEKLALYVNGRGQVTLADVDAIVTRSKQAKAFALADALGERNLPRLLRVLDEELWTLRTDKQKSAIGLLYGLIAKVRVMLFLKEMIAVKWIGDTWDPRDRGAYASFKAQLEKAPAEELPADRRLNPLAMNPWMLYVALPHARNYSRDELVAAMGRLLECNLRLVTSGTDEAVVLQQTLVEIVGQPRAKR